MKTYEGAEVSSQFHSPAKQRPVPRGKEAGGLRGRFGRCEMEINLLPLPGNEPLFLDRATHNLVPILTELLRHMNTHYG